jgi:hypothetical protein
LAFDQAGFTQDSYHSAFLFSPSNGTYVLTGASASGEGDGGYALGVAPPEDDAPLLFVLLFHAPEGGTVAVTAYTHGGAKFDEQFSRPRVSAEWDDTGPAEVSIYSEVSGRAAVAHNVEVDRQAAPLETGFSGHVKLTTAHTALPPGLELSKSFHAGIAAGGTQKLAWKNGETTQELAFPVAGGLLVPVRPYPGFRLVQPSAGASSASFELTGATATGAFRFEHHSLSVDLAALGIEIADLFEGPLEG